MEHKKEIGLSAMAVESLKGAPREALEAMPIIAAQILADISTGAVTKPPAADVEDFLCMLMALAASSKLRMHLNPHFGKQPEQPVKDVTQAADLLKKFTLH